MPTSQPDQTKTQEESQLKTEETSEVSIDGSEGTELPKEVSERTREQFEKLKAQLREYRERAFREERYRETVGEQKPLYDPNTGLVNVDALEETRKRAFEAERKLRALEEKMTVQAQNVQVADLYEAHPDLKNPKTKEAKELFDEAERIWMHSQAYPEKYGGSALSQKQAADLAKKKMAKSEEVVETQNMESKEQASLGATGRPSQGVRSKIVSEEETQRLSYGTRVGDKQSMIERMRKIREASQVK